MFYDQAFFARFEPDNAEDILLRIPGVPAILDTNNQRRGERGFGSGGAQVLLNGRRFPGKTNEINAALRRIPASNVARVELISGASSDINVQSQGLVVNVVMRPGASIGGSGSWELNGRFNERGRSSIDGLVSYNGAAGALSYGLGIERLTWSPPQFGMARWTYRTRDEIYWYPNGSVQELRPQVWRRSYEKWIFTGNLTYDFPSGAQTNLNGFYETRDVIETGVTRLTRFSLTGLETLRAMELQAREQDGVDVLEVSGEHVSALGPGNFTGLFIVRRQGNRTVDFRNLDLSTHITEVSRSDSNVDTGEDIVRVSYVLPLGVGRSVEMGTEGARNTLKQKLLIFADQNEDGVLDRVGSNAAILEPKVKELRGEVFGVFKWQATKSLSLETSLNYEYSKLTTNYPSQPERKLSFLKPRLDARFKVTTRDQIRVLIQRTVSQLNFNTFVPRYNMADDVVESGNPSLEPEKAWTFEVGYERRLPRDGGLIDVRAFYEDITDAIDRHPFCRIGARLEPVSVCLAGAPPLGARLDSAFGNIPEAARYGLEAKASLRLGFLGHQGAVLSVRGLRQWSNIEDPFVGRKRRRALDPTYSYDIGFRHDLTRWRMSYGFDYKSLGLATINSELLYTEYYEIDPLLEIFVERRLSSGLTLRLQMQNLTHSHERRSRNLYDVQPAGGAIQQRLRRVDFFEERRDIRFAVRLRGRF